MVVINIGIGTDKKAMSRLAITLEGSSVAGEVDCENAISEIHALIWRWLSSWVRQDVTITIEREDGWLTN